MFYTLFCVFHREVNGSQLLSPVVNRVNICGSPCISSCRLSLLVNRCKPMSTDCNFMAIKKPRTFNAIEIRHKIMRKMTEYQIRTAKC